MPSLKSEQDFHAVGKLLNAVVIDNIVPADRPNIQARTSTVGFGVAGAAFDRALIFTPSTKAGRTLLFDESPGPCASASTTG